MVKTRVKIRVRTRVVRVVRTRVSIRVRIRGKILMYQLLCLENILLEFYYCYYCQG
jgi:hypothetical protein